MFLLRGGTSKQFPSTNGLFSCLCESADTRCKAWRMTYQNSASQSFYHLLVSSKGDRSPIEAEKDAVGYSTAWMHHKGHNPHHWEYWVDFGENGEPIPARIPYKYVVEMMCDYVAAGMVYSKESWTPEEPLRYFDKVRDGRHFHPETERLIRVYLKEIAKRGVDRACELAKNKFYNYGNNYGRYNGGDAE